MAAKKISSPQTNFGLSKVVNILNALKQEKYYSAKYSFLVDYKVLI